MDMDGTTRSSTSDRDRLQRRVIGISAASGLLALGLTAGLTVGLGSTAATSASTATTTTKAVPAQATTATTTSTAAVATSGGS